MPKKVTVEQRQSVLELLAQGQDRDTIAAAVGITPGQVSAVLAHVKMGTYSLPEPEETKSPQVERTTNLLWQLTHLESAVDKEAKLDSIILGTDVENGDEVFWNPDPASGSANPHVLILGESGTGKTYATSCLVAELAQQGISSIIFDYGQGFSTATLPEEFRSAADPIELHVGRDGVDVNPLQIFPSDLHGPVTLLNASRTRLPAFTERSAFSSTRCFDSPYLT